MNDKLTPWTITAEVNEWLNDEGVGIAVNPFGLLIDNRSDVIAIAWSAIVHLERGERWFDIHTAISGGNPITVPCRSDDEAAEAVRRLFWYKGMLPAMFELPSEDEANKMFLEALHK